MFSRPFHLSLIPYLFLLTILNFVEAKQINGSNTEKKQTNEDDVETANSSTTTAASATTATANAVVKVLGGVGGVRKRDTTTFMPGFWAMALGVL
ncbi:MAG: hypothetical protein MMC23_008195 [Stictis urceolatum]|nr:hypothetical protein [Stictis urceolata]